jgi:hypothetical protein
MIAFLVEEIMLDLEARVSLIYENRSDHVAMGSSWLSPEFSPSGELS